MIYRIPRPTYRADIHNAIYSAIQAGIERGICKLHIDKKTEPLLTKIFRDPDSSGTQIAKDIRDLGFKEGLSKHGSRLFGIPIVWDSDGFYLKEYH